MPAPEFVLELRKKIGHDPLWVPGVRGVVIDSQGRILLAQRADNKQWALVSGMLEPGEQPAMFPALPASTTTSRWQSAGSRWTNCRR